MGIQNVRLQLQNLPRLLSPATKIAAGLILLYGVVVVFAQIQPFWVDEWRLMYSLKFMSASELFGPLRFTQQFPRVHLVLLKAFTSLFDYSYFVLRLPAFLTAAGSILLGWKLMNRLFGTAPNSKFLFLLIVIASHTFLKYLVQIKHYEMELFLSLVGIWQLLQLTSIGTGRFPPRRAYLLLCLSCAIAPFFSYTYPIVIAPIFLIVLIQSTSIARGEPVGMNRRKALFGQWLPLTLGAISIVVFYYIDVSRVMEDKGMHCYWQEQMLNGLNGESMRHFLSSAWGLFGTPGSGDLFRQIFAFVGLAAFIVACRQCKDFLSAGKTEARIVVHYAVSFMLLVILLFIAGKLPLGESRLSSFAVPAMAILIVDLLRRRDLKIRKWAIGTSSVLYVALLCNIGLHIIHEFTNAQYARALKTYTATEDAILYAKARQMPIVVTPGVAYPYDIVHDNSCLEPMDAEEVLKTFPAYQERDGVPVYTVSDTTLVHQIALADVTQLEVGDGIHYRVVGLNH